MPDNVSVPVLDDTFVQDPHNLFAASRAELPVRRAVTANGLPCWLVTRYADARFVLTDSRFGKDFPRTKRVMDDALGENPNQLDLSSSLGAHMLNTDPPDHTRLRKLVMKAFTPRRVEVLRPRIEEITKELLDAAAGKSTVDLLDVLAFPLPIRVISELLGVEEDRKDEFREWSNALVSGDATRFPEAAKKMSAYLAELIERKRQAPADDLLSDLIEASEDADRLAEHELLAMTFLLLVAGHETTVNLIGNCVLALLSHPEQFAALRANPDLVSDAIEETLRFEGPVQVATFRHTTEAVTVGEVEIPADQIVLVALNSANRDADRFDDPDTFDITRSATGHLAFGHGIHFCVGAPLARMEGQIAVQRLVERFPDLALAVEPDQLRWRFSNLMRGLETLPVRLAD